MGYLLQDHKGMKDNQGSLHPPVYHIQNHTDMKQTGYNAVW